MNRNPSRPPPTRRRPGRPSLPAVQALTDEELARLEMQLETLPEPLEPLSVGALDGFLCGVLLQPQTVAPGVFLPRITDAQGRSPPAAFDLRPIHTAVRRRHAELQSAIAGRRWFDPWVFDDAGDADPAAVVPWVTGFAFAMECFPSLIDRDEPELTHPLALIFRHLPAEDLEDAQEVLDEIEQLEPPATLADAIEELVRATLLLADVADALRAG